MGNDWSNLLDEFTSIDEKLGVTIGKLNALIGKLDTLIGLMNTLIGSIPSVPQPPETIVTQPTVFPRKLITIPNKVSIKNITSREVTPDKDITYRTSGDIILILPNGDDIYMNIMDTTAVDTNFKLPDGVGLAISLTPTELHFRSVSASATIYFIEFNYVR